MVFVVIMTGVVGAVMARLQGFLALQRIQESMAKGIVPTQEILDGFLILAGALLLVAPGLITDTVGFLLIVPWTRRVVSVFLVWIMKGKMAKGTVVAMHTRNTSNRIYDI